MSAPITAGWDDRGPYLVVDGECHRLTAPQAREIREALQVSAPSPGPRPSTLATVATPAPAVYSTSTDAPTRLPSASGAQRFLPAARDWCYRLGVSQDQVGAILDDPVEEWVTRAKTTDVAISSDGEIAIVTGLEDDMILAVMPHGRAVMLREREPGTPRGRGGAGTRYPTTQRELLQRLEGEGCVVERTRHHIHVHRAGAMCTVPSTPSDRRSLMNSIKSLERTLRVDLRRHPA